MQNNEQKISWLDKRNIQNMNRLNTLQLYPSVEMLVLIMI